MTNATNNGRPSLSNNRMLSAAAYSESLLPSLRLARSSRHARRIGRILLGMLVAGFVLAAAAPWQQSVTGNGSVIAFKPGERQQTIDVPVKGRLTDWAEGVYENAHVKAGDVIAEIEDIDPNRLFRLQQQELEAESQVRHMEQVVKSAEGNLAQAKLALEQMDALLETQKAYKVQVVESAEFAVAAAKNKEKAERRTLEGHEAKLIQLKADYHRQVRLFDRKAVAEVKKQIAEAKYLECLSKVETSKEYVLQAENDVKNKESFRNAKAEEAQGKIDDISSKVEKFKGDVEKANQDIAKQEAELAKAKQALIKINSEVSRQENQKVTAPFDGFLTRINANQGGKILKPGDVLCEIVPDTADRAVQIWLDGNDASLVDVGRHVRLQFEGWPAVQFAGWPSVAVGTFGGTIVSVDANATDDGSGRFRVLVRPDTETSQAWPNERFLRQGVQAHAWVLLEQVPLWYEVWRNMNGFPPTVTPNKGEDKSKKPKLPK